MELYNQINSKAFDENRIILNLNQEKCNLAIMWLKLKINDLGLTIKNEHKFNEEIMDYIKNSFVQIGSKAVLSSAETLFKKKNGKKSLEEIFKENNIDIGKYIFSITITSREVFVVDGEGNARRRIEYDGESFRYFSLKRSRKIIDF